MFTSYKFLLPTFLIALIYFLLVIYLMNFSLVKNTLIGPYALQYKYALMMALLGGMWTAMTHLGLIVLIVTALLTGLNLALLFQRIQFLKKSGGVHLIVGGSSILGIVGSGCAACGLPIIALFGITGSFLSLPFHGQELSFIAIILLATSLIILVRSKQSAKSCIINPKYNFSH